MDLIAAYILLQYIIIELNRFNSSYTKREEERIQRKWIQKCEKEEKESVLCHSERNKKTNREYCDKKRTKKDYDQNITIVWEEQDNINR